MNNSLKKLVVFYLNNTINLRPHQHSLRYFIPTKWRSYHDHGSCVVSSPNVYYLLAGAVWSLNFVCYVVGPHFIVLLLCIVRKKIRPNFEEPTHLFSLLSTKPAGSFSILSSQRRQDVFLHSFLESSFHSHMLLQVTLALSLGPSSIFVEIGRPMELTSVAYFIVLWATQVH